MFLGIKTAVASANTDDKSPHAFFIYDFVGNETKDTFSLLELQLLQPTQQYIQARKFLCLPVRALRQFQALRTDSQ